MVVNSYSDSLAPDDLDMTVFGQRVREWRKRAKLSQGRLATLSGLKQPSLSAIENGDTKLETLRAGNLVRMARALGVSAEELYTGRAPADAERRGLIEGQVLALLKQMSTQSIEAWLENGATLIRHQAPVKVAERVRELHTERKPHGRKRGPSKGVTTEAELVEIHGRQEANRIIAGEVEQDDARKKRKPADPAKRARKQPSGNSRPVD